MTRRLLFVVAIFLVLSLSMAQHAQADVVFLNDGSIILGTLVDANGLRLVYDSLGVQREISFKDVLKTEKELSSLGDRPYDVTLVDGMVFTGSIADFDPDIGLFVNLSIGTLTLPVAGLKSIVDREARRLWAGSGFSLSISEFYSWLPGNEFFGSSFSTCLSASARLPIRGLSAGILFEWTPLSYKASSSVEYSLYSAIPRIGYRFLDLRRAKGFLSLLAPFAFVGAGPTYISVKDSREGAISASYGSVVLNASAELGIDVFPMPELSIRISGKPAVILQAGSPFISVGAGLSATWEIQ